ncbi:MAG: putative toxin-antitoxin system toxin component, PIN family [Acidobacteria bacterium ACB1]|nr:putative toxin-antitoxin system toxin component, PIN family [Acidobacteria bacterium ACB1]RIJ94039.1 MAG: putative toxin-antitoxin system toxin component, PIN family [Acidobacteriota bacterium]
MFIACIGRRSPFRWIFDGVISGRFILCVSNEILLEYREVLERKTTPEIAENVANFLVISPYTEHIEVFYIFNLILADETDNKFVDCAIAANADALVSNDKHFEVLSSIDFPKVQLLKLSEFSDLHRDSLG